RRLTGGNRLHRRLCRDWSRDRCATHRESGGVAGHAACCIADDDRELGAAVGSHGGGCGVAGGGGCADRRAVLLPLVAQGCRARGRDREGRRLTGGHRLPRRLCRDRGRDQRSEQRRGGGVWCPAGLLVTRRAALLSTTVNWAPLSAVVVAGVV